MSQHYAEALTGSRMPKAVPETEQVGAAAAAATLDMPNMEKGWGT